MNRHRTYRPQPPQIPADPLCGNPCDSRDPRSHVPPLKGLRETLTASVSYRASVPAGHAYCEVAPSHRALAPAADRQNRSFKALSGKGSAPATPPPFRHTPGQSRPRHTAPVWRNLGQHPHRDGTFTFSAKERDSETGLSYFGSRYYSSDLSIWLSVDPQSDKYASLSPYTYCADNPVKLVDPNGEEVIEDNPPGGIISNFLNNLENKIYGTAENRQFEGGGDGANQGTMTMQDVEVGVSVMTAMVSAGTALEAKSAIETTVAIVSAASSVDDATVNSSGQTVSQKAAANNKGASKTVTFVKTASSLASGGLSCRNVKNIVVKGTKELKKNVSKMANNVFSAASSAYSVFSILLKKKNQTNDE